MAWDLDAGPSTFPPHLPSQLESLVSGPAIGRRKRAERKRGWRWRGVQEPFLVGTSTHPPETCQEGARVDRRAWDQGFTRTLTLP